MNNIRKITNNQGITKTDLCEVIYDKRRNKKDNRDKQSGQHLF